MRKHSFRPEDYRESVDFKSKRAEKGWGHDQLRGFANSPYVDKLTVPVVTEAIDKLSARQHERLSYVLSEPTMARYYGVLQRAAKQLYNSKFYDKYIVERLREKVITSVEPGTVGQFLFGNLVANNIENTNCSPIHIGAIPLDGQTVQPCEKQIWYYDGQLFRQLTKEMHPAPEHADIYVPNDQHAVNFNLGQMNYLKNHGIRWATFYSLFYDQNDGTTVVDSRRITEEVDLWDHDRPNDEYEYVEHVSVDERPDLKYDSSYWIWILVVIFAFIIVGFIVYWIGLKRGYNMAYQSTVHRPILATSTPSTGHINWPMHTPRTSFGNPF